MPKIDIKPVTQIVDGQIILRRTDSDQGTYFEQCKVINSKSRDVQSITGGNTYHHCSLNDLYALEIPDGWDILGVDDIVTNGDKYYDIDKNEWVRVDKESIGYRSIILTSSKGVIITRVISNRGGFLGCGFNYVAGDPHW